jgi:hypothetical protein
MPPEDRAGGVLIASDEDDFADLYLLDQATNLKTNPPLATESMDMTGA